MRTLKRSPLAAVALLAIGLAVGLTLQGAPGGATATAAPAAAVSGGSATSAPAAPAGPLA
jgi:hypothetical protein